MAMPPFDLSLQELYGCIFECPGLARDVSFKTALGFIQAASALKDAIIHDQPPSFDPAVCPPVLSQDVYEFLAGRLDISAVHAGGLWSALREIIWEHGEGVFAHELFPQFDEVLDKSGRLAGRTIYPPKRTCENPQCSRQRLLRHKAKPTRVSLFTLRNGVSDVWHVHLHCNDCGTEYYCDHSSYKGVRTYYADLPAIVQVATHTFMERDLLEHFLKLSLLSWTSATNAAHIYHNSLSGLGDNPETDARHRLRTEHVWDGFILNALLKDAKERAYVLRVPDTGEQKDRFTDAMRARNRHMQRAGQPEFNHYCTRCTRLYEEETDAGPARRMVDAIVLDGIDMGRPCCGVRHCTNELLRTQDRYCAQHWQLNHLCAITGCTQRAEKDFRTCSNPQHRATEEWWRLHGKGMFTLRKRLQRAQVSHPTDAVEPNAPADEVIEVALREDGTSEAFEAFDNTPENTPENAATYAPPDPLPSTTPSVLPDCPDKPPTGNRSMRATFGRRRTHNEELGTRPCGIICFRETFYGSETTPQVLDLIRKKYTVPGTLPRFCFYDNCCGLYMHSQASGETLHLEMGMPVDVFHWKTKHKKSNDACSIHCNPYTYPELIASDNSWYFNSSIAEQTNVWLGGYHAIIREMSAVLYDFFLDEMIKEKNRLTRQKLVAQNCRPRYRPLPERM
ncbi:hypothetical protein OH77DRAFT_1594523 [Trametes cingulata]|nr:hypothetical protein OH77DRAFT_1594523 [Trametes cingulata]